MTGMTPEQLAEIKERADKATPGPWERGDIWSVAGVVFDAYEHQVGPGESATHCACCYLGAPEHSGPMDINGTVMPAHRHRDTDPYGIDHRISGPGGVTVAGNYDYESGGILRPEDTEFIVHARQDVDDLAAEVARLRTLTATCTCGTAGCGTAGCGTAGCGTAGCGNYEGPQADCAIHGAIRGLNEAQVEVARLTDLTARMAEENTRLVAENARLLTEAQEANQRWAESQQSHLEWLGLQEVAAPDTTDGGAL